MRVISSPPEPKSPTKKNPRSLVSRVLRLPFPNSRSQIQQLVSPGLWIMFVSSVILWLSALFVTNWRPIVFPLAEVNPTVLRPLPDFLQVSHTNIETWLPVALAGATCIGLRWLPPNNVTRLVVRLGVGFMAVRYLLWRSTATLNLTHWVSALLSLLFFANEIVWISSYLIYYLQSTWTTDKRRTIAANRYAQDVLAGRYLPSVDVFVPSYKEPEYIVRRTVVGCQAMDYPNKTIYILDDTRRPHIKQLAEELGCRYITRPDNKHAKAGNLNNALPQTDGELITVMDADFVPFRNFLTRTVGFFQDANVDLVQTPQFFYNPDYHARNLGLDGVLPNDLEHFFGYVQPGRDTGNCVICCGTSYVVRRSSVEAIGGYYTRCCVEDYQTSIRLLTHGFRIIYLNEMLSMGESTRMFADFIDQRLRWLQGNLQVYFCGQELPIWSKLNWVQKSYHLTLILFSFNPVIRAIALIVPLVSLLLGPSPLVASVPEYIFYAVPFVLLYTASFTWATDYRLSAFWNEVHETTFCFPALGRIWLILRNPFAKASTATRKGVKAETKNYNLHLTYPLLILLGLSAIGLFIHYGGYVLGFWPEYQYEYEGKQILIFWIVYNMIVMGVSVLSSIDQPVRRVSDRFPLCTACKVTSGNRHYWGYTNNLSETGSRITLTTNRFLASDQPVEIEFLEHEFSVTAEVVRSTLQDGHSNVSLKFIDVTVEQSRHLVTLLYCDTAEWKQRKRVGGLDSILMLLSSVLKLKPILNIYNR
ncbi:glycosyltransferase [Pantanalinema rosaneae CENA516]|uniref:glycosyltransferase n=1 Tax=Pantanalinema rosaneae TaxID=1620701 RepID=UPI003D6E4697